LMVARIIFKERRLFTAVKIPKGRSRQVRRASSGRERRGNHDVCVGERGISVYPNTPARAKRPREATFLSRNWTLAVAGPAAIFTSCAVDIPAERVRKSEWKRRKGAGTRRG
jgi:hypothetical protein